MRKRLEGERITPPHLLVQLGEVVEHGVELLPGEVGVRVEPDEAVHLETGVLQTTVNGRALEVGHVREAAKWQEDRPFCYCTTTKSAFLSQLVRREVKELLAFLFLLRHLSDILVESRSPWLSLRALFNGEFHEPFSFHPADPQEEDFQDFPPTLTSSAGPVPRVV